MLLVGERGWWAGKIFTSFSDVENVHTGSCWLFVLLVGDAERQKVQAGLGIL